MNVNDFNVEVPEGDMLEIIFNHQRDLIDKYHPIEESIVGHLIPSDRSRESVEVYDGGFRPRWQHAGPLNIQDRASQLRMKDFAWRITEELTEATLALIEEDEMHYLEELIDALHFSVELLTMCGLEPSDLSRLGGRKEMDYFEALFIGSNAMSPQEYKNWEIKEFIGEKQIMSYEVIEKLGEAMNRLKLKPWKATGVLTDEKLFHQSMTEFFWKLIDLLKVSGLTAKTTTQLYLNKNAVNQFRIASKY